MLSSLLMHAVQCPAACRRGITDTYVSYFRLIQLGMCENHTTVLTTVWSVPVMTMVNSALSMLSPTARDSILAPAELPESILRHTSAGLLVYMTASSVACLCAQRHHRFC